MFHDEFPSLAAQWHPTKNASPFPPSVGRASQVKAWWLCEVGHSWFTSVLKRTQGRGCHVCTGQAPDIGVNDLATLYPLVAAQWSSKNTSSPREVLPGSNRRVFWECEAGHEWSVSPRARANGAGCPYCSGREAVRGVNDLQTMDPALASEWHQTNNDHLRPCDVLPHSNLRVHWLCSSGHTWVQVVSARTRGHGCPFCSGRLAVPGVSDLATTRPSLASEWSLELNGSLTPDAVTASSGKRIWWVCEYKHSWEASVHSRAAGKGCPYCSGRQVLVGVNDLQTVRPELAMEFSERNDVPASSVSVKSGKKFWWVCGEGHEWRATAAHRSNGTSCPKCRAKISAPERALYEALVSCIPDLRLDITLPSPGWSRGAARCDMASSALRLVIEYDGWFYHRDRLDRDGRKTDALIKAGWAVVRVRAAGSSGQRATFLDKRVGLKQIGHTRGESAEDLAAQILALVSAQASEPTVPA